MPIYEYLCESCGKITEVMHKISEHGPTSCSECSSDRIARLVSRSAFQLKGGGWYADLYGSKKKEAAAPAPASQKEAATPAAAPQKEAAASGEKKPSASGSGSAK